MKRKPPLPLSKDQHKLMERIVEESRGVIHDVFVNRDPTTMLEDVPQGMSLKLIADAEFLSGVAVGIGIAIKWNEQHPKK